MLIIDRTQPPGSAGTAFLDATVSIRDKNQSVAGKPDLVFSIKTYERIARDKADNVGERILLPINLFFETLSFDEQIMLYDLYAYSLKRINTITVDNWRKVQDDLQARVYAIINELDLSSRMIAFCKTPYFSYPNLDEAGTLPHHSPAKTFVENDYIEITAISLLTKMMVPIWGELIKELGDLKIDPNQRENIAFDLIELSLEESAFTRIYSKLTDTSVALIALQRAMIDGKSGSTSVTSSYILTHNGIDDQMFDAIVMSIIIVKRMATYECFTRIKDNVTPNAMVYIDDGIKRTASTRINQMRNDMNTMPRRELASYETEDNSSILDHASKTSKKPMDNPIFVVTAVERWDLPKLIEELDTPMNVFNSAADYYVKNSFDVSPLCQAMVASFIGNRFGGSKCLNYLTPKLYQKIVILLQIYLIRNDMIDLAQLISAKTPLQPIDGAINPIGTIIRSKLRSIEYLQCQKMIVGYLRKPVVQVGRKVKTKKIELDTIDFTNHIDRMIDWLVHYTHSENMAPSLWALTGRSDYLGVGSEVRFDENVISHLCRFYLTFHSGTRPF